MAEQGLVIFTEFYFSFALGAGENIKQFFFHVFLFFYDALSYQLR